MECTDLMLDDWVLDTYTGKPMRVPCVNIKVGKGLEPIPLTDKILEKNGFVRREDLVERIDEGLPFVYQREETLEEVVIKWRDSYDNGFRDENMECWGEYWEMCVFGILGRFEKSANILYVHELQHALKLCGIDKEIVV